MTTKALLELRKRMNAVKPDFVRQDLHKKPNLKKKWRKPRGLHSKLRLRKRGKGKHVSRGYRSPVEVRGLDHSGLIVMVVSSPNTIRKLDSKKYGIVISSAVGKKKRVEMLKTAKEHGFNVLNIRNPDDYIKKAEERLKKAKAESGIKSQTKEAKKEEKSEEKVSAEDQKDAEKKEKDKVLTKRER